MDNEMKNWLNECTTRELKGAVKRPDLFDETCRKAAQIELNKRGVSTDEMKDANGQTFSTLIQVQRDQLFEWRLKLNAVCYEDLVRFCRTHTKKARSSLRAHNVPRGTNLTEFICNWGGNKQ